MAVSSSGTAAVRIVGRVKDKRNSDDTRPDETPVSVALQLSPELAFVLHLDARARPPRRMLGRIEHVTTGRIARVGSLRELTTFLRDVFREVAGS
jgi:hypothetical protein